MSEFGHTHAALDEGRVETTDVDEAIHEGATVKPADLGRLDVEDSAKIVGTVALTLWTQDMLVRQGQRSSQHHQGHLAAAL